MSPMLRRMLFAVAAILLLLAPTFLRTAVFGYNRRSYAGDDVPAISIAATPIPTATPLARRAAVASVAQEMRPGPVVVDLAHGNRLVRSQFEPLAAALANLGIGLRFWLSDVDILSLSSFLDYPDQSGDLAMLLEDASAMVVASPFFLWSSEEIDLIERFVADGGRLLVVSDPDVVGDLAQDINTLAEPFGAVFNDDYLYDTVENDGNHIHVFQGHFEDIAADLTGSTVAFYGARSISGEVTPVVVSADTTLSNIRTGMTEFTTVAVAGLESRGTAGRVLAMSDLDVLTMPYVERHDNQQMVEFVAEFLAGGERTATVTDFPAYLGKEVALIFANTSAVDADVLLQGAKLQRSLEDSGRTLTLAGRSVLSPLLMSGVVQPEVDFIVLGDYSMGGDEYTLLSEFGFTLVEVTATATPHPDATATPVPTSTPVPQEEPENSPEQTPTENAQAGTVITVTSSLAVTPGAPSLQSTPPPGAGDDIAGEDDGEQAGDAEGSTDEEPTPQATPTPQPVEPEQSSAATPEATVESTYTLYLETEDGLRLVAEETVLIAQQQLPEGHRLVAIMGSTNAAIRSGVDRLLMGVYAGCVTGPDLIVCSFEGNGEPDEDADMEDTGDSAAEPEVEQAPPAAVPTGKPAGREPSSARILVIDDNDTAAAEEFSEADVYLQVLAGMEYRPDLWMTTAKGVPTIEDLSGYQWVIWSSGAYELGGPSLPDLDPLLAYINGGGRLTISSRRPFFGMGTDDPSVIADVVVEGDLPALTEGLPVEPIDLPNGLPPVVPLESAAPGEGPRVALRRGPDSGAAGAPVLFLATDADEPNPTGAHLMVLGMSLTWLPDEYQQILTRNMANVMLNAATD